MTINLGWKILQKKFKKFWPVIYAFDRSHRQETILVHCKKSPKFIGQWQILIVTEFPQVFDLGADGKGMSYVASLTQDRITQRAASTAR